MRDGGRICKRQKNSGGADVPGLFSDSKQMFRDDVPCAFAFSQRSGVTAFVRAGLNF